MPAPSPPPMRHSVLFLLCSAFALAASGCDSGRSYPATGDYPEVGLYTLTGQPAGRYNTTAYVSAVRVCGPTGDCSYTEAVELVEGPDLNPSVVLLAVEAGEQFEVGARYRLSVEVGAQPRRADREDEEVRATLTLLGYDRL